MAANGKSRDKLLDEIKFGGKEPPCPFCKLPRVKRSDYVRCVRCAINWMEGEPLDADPRTVRLQKFLGEASGLPVVKKKERNALR
jgi:hypothetical protein